MGDHTMMGVRNLLREGGFDWGPVDMDDLWAGLVERAVKKKFRQLDSKIKGLYYFLLVIPSPQGNGR
jgi:hypothetical protein